MIAIDREVRRYGSRADRRLWHSSRSTFYEELAGLLNEGSINCRKDVKGKDGE
jgi:hypothetical protein